MARKLPWVVVSESATETARHLIQQAGGVQAARDAVARAAKSQKRKRGAPAKSDGLWIIIADILRRQGDCSDNSALEQTAEIVCGSDTAARRAMVRRLRRKLGGKPLGKIARTLPFYGQVDLKREKPQASPSFRLVSIPGLFKVETSPPANQHGRRFLKLFLGQ